MKEQANPDGKKAIRVLTEADLNQVSGGVGGDSDSLLRKAKRKT